MTPAALSAGGLGERRVLVHQHLAAQAHAFISDSARAEEFLDKAIPVPAYLAHVLANEGLVAFSRALRDSISLLKRSVDTQPFWQLVDAIGFWEDSTPGRWPHMTLKTMNDRLDWAAEYRAGDAYQHAA